MVSLMDTSIGNKKDIYIYKLLVGEPETVTDEQGSWTSAIFRKPVADPVYLNAGGLAGDRVADKKHHGSPEQAVCCHYLEHYLYWNDRYQLENNERALEPGVLGENWTLSGATEADFCIGDVYRVGEAVVQVTCPRFPCWKQERRTGLTGFLQQVKESQRTGFYFKVLEPGIVQVGNSLSLEARPNPGLSIHQLNTLIHQSIDPELAEKFLELEGLPEGWKSRLLRLLNKHLEKGN
ncbi:MAG: MOSC domain-containing protein [Chloroflexi bacterium]|nr:MAG: MOSC domain-containing protein [Chloroflexota bacterium]